MGREGAAEESLSLRNGQKHFVQIEREKNHCSAEGAGGTDRHGRQQRQPGRKHQFPPRLSDFGGTMSRYSSILLGRFSGPTEENAKGMNV